MTVSVLAENVDRETMPDWLVTDATMPRLNGRMGKTGATLDWRFIYGLAIDESGLRAPHRAVLHVLRSFAPGSSWAVSTIAARAGVVRTTASKILAELDEWGWLFIEHAGSNAELDNHGSGSPSKYRLAIPIDPPPDRVKRPRRVADDDTYVSQMTTPVSQMTTPRVADDDTRLEGSQVPCKAPTTAPSGRVSDVDPRWLKLTRRIEEGVDPKQVKPRERRRIADVIAGVHGYGIDDETLGLVLNRLRVHMLDGCHPIAALAASLGRTEAEIRELERVHHDGRSVA